jgi:phosphoserine aminotransferase
MLPLEVLEQAASEMTDFGGTGQSVMEMRHRSADYKPIIEGAQALIRELMGVPDNYKVLFLQGGASLQFAMAPLNLAPPASDGKRRSAGYANTGVWAQKAIQEGSKYVDVHVTASSEDKNFTYIPVVPPVDSSYAYYHICLNNTIFGTKWPAAPAGIGAATPLIADISSCILSEPLDVSRFGMVYAGAQKNLGPAGCTVVILRDDLLRYPPAPDVPVMLRYDTHIKDGSMYNTPPCYAIYMMGLVLAWLKKQGGARGIGQANAQKAAMLYDFLDNSRLFKPVITDRASRSIMNITFITGDADTDSLCVRQAAKAGLVNLAGHRLTGGLRASLYNAMPLEGVKALVRFLQTFEREH